MNKSNSRQKRSIGKDSPLSKRPKLDFTSRSKESLSGNKDNNKDAKNGYHGNVKDKGVAAKSFENKVEGNIPAASDWDDDFSGDMLEKVCLIADLSQAVVNSQAVPNEIITQKEVKEMFEKTKLPLPAGLETLKNSDLDSFEKLKLEYEKLQEKFKTKEGEVHILRSQLKQNEGAKQTAALQNIKMVEEIQKKFTERISATEKELETTKTKLQFKDMEYKTLTERCRQLEYNLSKNKLVLDSTSVEVTKSFANASQAVHPKIQTKETENEGAVVVGDSRQENIIKCEFPSSVRHEGKSLVKIVCPEFFKFVEEPSVVPLYTFRTGISLHASKLDFDQRKKYKWNDLPKQTVFNKDLYDLLTRLFVHETFTNEECDRSIRTIFDRCRTILIYYKEVFLFLNNLQLENSEYDDPDQSLLENEEKVDIVTIKNLLDGIKLKEEECGIEGRRSLALVYALIKSSRVAFDLVKSDVDFISLLRDLTAAIGNLRRPLRYTGILIGIAFILQEILLEKELKKDVLTLINEIVEEIIFARPKLDVLREVVNVLAAGKNNLEFQSGLCRKASVESCALYMDSRLKQAMFFTKNACPLKLLCMQIMGLACLPSSKAIRWDLTDCIIKWLNNSISTPHYKKIKWLPINPCSIEEDRCFDVTECLLYLLTLCVKDYNYSFPPQDDKDGECSVQGLVQNKADKRKLDLISIIGHGATLLKRILKANGRQLHENTHSLRFAALLKALLPSKSDLCHTHHMSHISSVQMEAISWIINLFESGLRNQDCVVKQNISTLPDIDIFNALMISNESKLY